MLLNQQIKRCYEANELKWPTFKNKKNGADIPEP